MAAGSSIAMHLRDLISGKGRDVRDILRSQAAFIVTALVGIVLSVTLIPRGSELGLLNLELGRTSEALQVLEARYEAGDHSLATIGALAEAKARAGDRRSAIDLLRGVAADNENGPAPLDSLAKLLLDEGRLEEASDTLTRLVALRPSPRVLRQLAGVYDALQRPVLQLAVLRELARSPRPDPADLLALARMEGVAGDPRRGLEVLSQLQRIRRGFQDLQQVVLHASLLLAVGDEAQALRRAESWLAQSKTVHRDAMAFAATFAAAQKPALLVRLLDPLTGAAAPDDLVFARVQAQVDTGDARGALARLNGLLTARPASRTLQLFKLNLAISVTDAQRIVEAVTVLGAGDAPPSALAPIARAARALQRGDLTAAIAQRLDLESETLGPMQQAETWFALGEHRRALAIAASLSAELSGADARTIVDLASLEWRLARQRQARDVLRTLLVRPNPAVDPGAPDDATLDRLSRLAITIGLAPEATRYLRELRRDDGREALGLAWARVAAVADARQFLAWLSTKPAHSVSPDFLRDAVFLAVERRLDDVALRAAVRLASERGLDGDRLLLAEIQAMAGAPRSQLLSFNQKTRSAGQDYPVLR